MGEASVAAVTAIAGKLEQRVAAFVREHRLPGASAGIVVGDELVVVRVRVRRRRRAPSA